MSARSVKAAIAGCLLALLPGCVEITQIITLNPDGKGKMKLEITTAAYDFDMGAAFGAPGQKKVKSLDELKNGAITKFLGEVKGVTAFKDVSVKWTRDGRLHMVGTAYFEKLDDLNKEEKGPPQPGNIEPNSMFRNAFQVSRGKDGTMRITAKNPGIQEGSQIPKDQEKPADITKMSDKEADEYILKQRVDFQKIRPLFEMMFNGLKIKTVLQLPGDIAEVKGFQKDGPRNISQVIEGADILAALKKFIMMDSAELKKLAVANNEKDVMALLGPLAKIGEPDVTVKNLEAPQFDYDKEVREARAAYPALRKALNLDESVKLPGR